MPHEYVLWISILPLFLGFFGRILELLRQLGIYKRRTSNNISQKERAWRKNNYE
jgi:hypothetical protein